MYELISSGSEELEVIEIDRINQGVFVDGYLSRGGLLDR
jgi:hypothetical protein